MSKKVINSSIHNWINNNKEMLRQYRGKWIAHNDTEVLASAKKGEDLMRILDEKNIEKYTLAYLHPYLFTEKIRILPIRFRTVKLHEWSPFYPAKIIVDNNVSELDVLVDSGADLCVIPLALGEKLGLTLTNLEVPLKASGIGGNVSFVLRSLGYEIDNHLIKNVPTAWVLDEDCDDIILGREVIFDAFDIEFKQADEEIIFKYRGAKTQ